MPYLLCRVGLILRQLPERGGELQYRIKSPAELFERVAAESALLKA